MSVCMGIYVCVCYVVTDEAVTLGIVHVSLWTVEENSPGLIIVISGLSSLVNI